MNSNPQTDGPPEHQCPVCPRTLQRPWRFADDDCVCPLCGIDVLRLTVSPHTEYGPEGGRKLYPCAPSERTGRAVWLYWKPADDGVPGPLTLYAYWSRQRRETNKAPQRLRPSALDPARCWARFQGDRVASLEFAVAAAPTSPRDMMSLVLTPRPGRDGNVPMPDADEVLQGRLHLACEPLALDWHAFLIRQPKHPFRLTCTDPGLRGQNNTLLVYQRSESVTVPMQLAVDVPSVVLAVRATPAEGHSGDFVLEGLDHLPARVDPGRPIPFTIRIDSRSWEVNTSVPLTLSVEIYGQTTRPEACVFTLTPGCRLEFARAMLDLGTVQLGRVLTPSTEMTVRTEDGRKADEIRLRDYRVRRTPDEGDWLTVLHPTREELNPPPAVGAGAGGWLALQVDTRRLDRKRFDGTLLHGQVDLFDTRDRRWTCHVYARVERPRPLTAAIAFDWGTTNCCAAHSEGLRRQTPVYLEDQQAQTPEEFPSDVFFQDLSDPNNPKFLIGSEATVPHHPECCLRSLKRKFQLWDRVLAIDPEGRRHPYKVDDLVLLVLHRLVTQAEAAVKQEVRRLGFTFPTKWPPRVRDRFWAVLRRLQERLHQERGGDDEGVSVRVHEPIIDEANAVAIHVITREKIPDTLFYLIAYDFGGGTIDTTVLAVEPLDGGGDYRTRYVGVGGRRDFGGDEVTRAVLGLLRERLTQALQQHEPEHPRGTVTVLEIPVERDGTLPRNPHQEEEVRRHYRGLENWGTLWPKADQLKKALCAAGDQPVEAANFVRAIRDQIHCRVRVATGDATVDEFWKLADVLPLVEQQGVTIDPHLSISLREVYDHPLEDLDRTNDGKTFSVRQRVQDTVDELKQQCADAGIRPDQDPILIALAGGGCRLPLVRQLLEAAFPGRPPLYTPDFSKQRVAHGLANYYHLTGPQGFGGELARSVDVLHHPVGLIRRGRRDGEFTEWFELVVPAGAAVQDPTRWHPLGFTRSQMQTAGGVRELHLSLQVWRDGVQHPQLGWFDLARPEEPMVQFPEPLMREPLPLLSGTTYEGELRLLGADRIELRVRVQGSLYGVYRFQGADDPETALQG